MLFDSIQESWIGLQQLLLFFAMDNYYSTYFSRLLLLPTTRTNIIYSTTKQPVSMALLFQHKNDLFAV